MPSFSPAILENSEFTFISVYDPSIDWEASQCTKEEYLEHRDASKLVSSGEPFIKFWLKSMTKEELAIAFGKSGIDFDADGNQSVISEELPKGIATVVANFSLIKNICSLCIKQVDNLDDWPSKPWKEDSRGREWLTEDAFACLPEVVLQEITEYVLSQQEVSEELGKP